MQFRPPACLSTCLTPTLPCPPLSQPHRDMGGLSLSHSVIWLKPPPPLGGCRCPSLSPLGGPRPLRYSVLPLLASQSIREGVCFPLGTIWLLVSLQSPFSVPDGTRPPFFMPLSPPTPPPSTAQRLPPPWHHRPCAIDPLGVRHRPGCVLPPSPSSCAALHRSPMTDRLIGRLYRACGDPSPINGPGGAGLCP